MSEPVTLERGAVHLDGQPRFIFSGELISYRIPGHLWRDRLEKLKAAGLDTVGIYIAWNFHSAQPGAADFQTEDRDIGCLLDLAHEIGLHVIIRPGPYVCNEWDLGGYPGWLLREDAGDWRSGDPKHLAYCREWYRQVNVILKTRQHGTGGPIILYQIENEHRWNDRAFLGGLSDAAREDGITVPLVGNHDGGGLCVRDKLAEGTDVYTPVFEFYRWRGWLESLKRQIGSELPLMVLEYRCGEHPFWGEAPVAPDWPPSHWTISQDRLFLAVGANLLNHFVAAGGITPVGFNSDHIITSYVDTAPVAPWGELTKRFYEMRLLGECIQSLSAELAESRPWDIGWGTDTPWVECLARRGDQATFLIAINHTPEPREFTVALPGGRSLPTTAIGPQRTQLLLADVALAPDLTLIFCSFQVFKLWRRGDRVTLVVYAEPGQTGALILRAGQRESTHPLLCGKEVTRWELDRLTVYVAPCAIAERTWFVQTGNGLVPVFSNLDLVRPQPSAGEPVRAELRVGQPLRLRLPAEVQTVTVNGRKAETTSGSAGLQSIELTLPQLAEPVFKIGPVEGRLEAPWENQPAAGWMAARPLEFVPIAPGDYQWLTTFTATEPLPAELEFLGITNAEITVSLNGTLLGVYPPQRVASAVRSPAYNARFDATPAIRVGENQLAVHVHFHGRHNSGQPIHAGFSHPVVLRRGGRREEPVPQWHVSPAETRKWSVGELDTFDPHDLATANWEEVDLTQPNHHRRPAGTAHWREVRWYRTRVSIPADMRGRPLFLECPPVEEAWAYVGGRCLGHTRAATSTIFDLTPFGDRASVEVTLAVRHNWYFWTEFFGLTGAPRLVTADVVLDGNWWMRQGVEGTRERWFAVDAPGLWRPVAELPAARRIWCRAKISVEIPAGLAAPLYVELQDWHTRVVIYWNGEPLGLSHTVGPQRRFYIPEARVQRENLIVLDVDGYDRAAVCGEIRVGCFFQAVQLSLKID